MSNAPVIVTDYAGGGSGYTPELEADLMRQFLPKTLIDTIMATPRQLFFLDGGQGGPGGEQGSVLTANGAWQAFASGWGLWRGGTQLPPLPGFRREYRVSHQLLYNIGAVGATAANWYLKVNVINNALVFIDPGAPYNATRDFDSISIWISNSELEALADQHVYGQWLGNAQGAVYQIALRSFIIEGRYIRNT